MVAFLLLMFAAPNFTPLHVYAGTWKVSPAHATGAAGKSDVLVNRCVQTSASYNCQQVVNGVRMALVVFTATETPMKFHSQVVLPDGHVAGDSEVTLKDDHWIYSSSGTDERGRPVWYRTENVFSGRDRIHFALYESADNKTWVKKSEGDEVRAAQ